MTQFIKISSSNKMARGDAWKKSDEQPKEISV